MSPDEAHERTTSTGYLAAGYGVTARANRMGKLLHEDELEEGKHWAATVRDMPER